MPDISSVIDLDKHVVAVPTHRFIDQDCNHCLWALHDLGVRIDISKGASAIDAIRNTMATTAMEEGLDSILFIDADMVFGAEFAVELLMSDEPVVAGLYAAKRLGKGQINAYFAEGIKTVRFGEWATELVPLRRVGAGFLRIKTAVLRRMVDELQLPYCRTGDSWAYPFFMPMIVEENGKKLYLTEDYAFSWRCGQIGVTPMANTQQRLYHLGDYAFGWEEACGNYIPRSRNLEYKIPPT